MCLLHVCFSKLLPSSSLPDFDACLGGWDGNPMPISHSNTSIEPNSIKPTNSEVRSDDNGQVMWEERSVELLMVENRLNVNFVHLTLRYPPLVKIPIPNTAVKC